MPRQCVESQSSANDFGSVFHVRLIYTFRFDLRAIKKGHRERFWGYLMEHAQPKRLGDVTPQDLETYKTWRRSLGNSEQTVNNHLKDLQALYNRAAKMGFFTGTNPVAEVERYKVTRQLVTFHTEEQLLHLLEVVTNENPSIIEKNLEWTVLLGGWAGLRKKEIGNARWDWLHFGDKP